MADADAQTSNRALLKPSEVCELAGVQPYVLRSWELEFPALGVARHPGGPRLYRKSDVELVQRIKHLVFGQGLTVAGARRTIEEELGALPVEPATIPDLVDQEVRRRLAVVRQGLRSLLDMLSPPGAAAREGASAGDGLAREAAPLEPRVAVKEEAAVAAARAGRRSTRRSPTRRAVRGAKPRDNGRGGARKKART